MRSSIAFFENMERAARKPKQIYLDPQGQQLSLKDVDKKWRDTIIYHNGTENRGGNIVTTFDPENPLGTRLLEPGPDSPVCAKCALYEQGAQHPFMKPFGAEDPLVTVVFDSVSGKEDSRGEIGSDGPPMLIRKLVQEMGFDASRIRWAPATLCSARTGKLPNYSTKGNHCKIHLIQDIEQHPPKMIMTVGSAALGLLSFKSNAQDWGGRVLTYRGWPDDWLTDPDYMLDRPDPRDPKTSLTRGHPIMGKAPEGFRIPIVPIQSPRMVYMTQNQNVIKRWKSHVKTAFEMALQGVPPKVYDRAYWNMSVDPDEIAENLLYLINHPGTLTSYDTETNGVRPWAVDAAIVFMMFRWTDEDGNPKSIGFPWNYPNSPLINYLPELAPLVLEALYASDLIGHNITFDVLFTYANVPGANLVKLANAAKWDTWHMAYVMRQQRGTLGLEMIAYEWVPDLAGYEEDMTLLIELLRDLLHPGAGKGGHYANCPRDKWDTHLKPYVMGDVEVAYCAKPKIEAKLGTARTYRMPLADPTRRGRFRLFEPPPRSWVYPNVVSPAARMLMNMMGRGMHVDIEELARQEDIFPKKIREARDKLRAVDPKIIEWCQQMEETEPGWELDLEKKEHLKTILFDSRLLNLPVNRITESGQKLFGDTPEDLQGLPREKLVEYAALDKFTLNMLSVEHPQVRPLQEYKKIFKAYTTYIRPLRNAFSDKKHGGVDKKRRMEIQHLMRDGCVHASFKLTGTRGGRLSCSDPNLQQLPRDGLIKRIYTSRFGKRGCVYQGDLSQIELRLLAAACGDSSMVDAYQRGIDLHALTHSKIYSKAYEECTNEFMEWLQAHGRDSEAKKVKLERKAAKVVNFLTGYGGGAFGLQTALANDQIYKTLEECEALLEAFFDGYPAMRRYLSYYKDFIQQNGVAVSILGRVRIFEEVFGDDPKAKNKALRAGCNHLIQSTASDLMLICLTAIENILTNEGLESQMVCTVHDSLVVDAVREELPVVHDIVYGVLNNIPDVLKLTFGDNYDTSWLSFVPLAGDCEVGLNYLDAKKVPQHGEIDWDKLLAPAAAH